MKFETIFSIFRSSYEPNLARHSAQKVLHKYLFSGINFLNVDFLPRYKTD